MAENGESNPNGRPPKLRDKRTRALFCKALALLGSKEKAAKFIGVSKSTVLKEIREDPEFRMQVERSVERLKMKLLKKIWQAKDWKAQQWLLQVQDNERFVLQKPDVVTRDQFNQTIQSFVTVVLPLIPAELIPEAQSKIQGLLTGAKNGHPQTVDPQANGIVDADSVQPTVGTDSAEPAADG